MDVALFVNGGALMNGIAFVEFRGSLKAGHATQRQWLCGGWTMQHFRPELVPTALRPLLELAARWGLVADSARHATAETASEADLESITTTLAGRHREIEDWLYSLPDDKRTIPEAVALQSLVVFEMERCGGPGLRGWLDHAVLVASEHPSRENLDCLRRAHEYTRASLSPSTQRLYADQLEAAEKLLKGNQ